MTEAQPLLTFSPHRADTNRNASGCLLFKRISFCLLSENVKCSSLSSLATFASFLSHHFAALRKRLTEKPFLKHHLVQETLSSHHVVPFDIRSTRTSTNGAERFQLQSPEKQIVHVSQKKTNIASPLFMMLPVSLGTGCGCETAFGCHFRQHSLSAIFKQPPSLWGTTMTNKLDWQPSGWEWHSTPAWTVQTKPAKGWYLFFPTFMPTIFSILLFALPQNVFMSVYPYTSIKKKACSGWATARLESGQGQEATSILLHGLHLL